MFTSHFAVHCQTQLRKSLRFNAPNWPTSTCRSAALRFLTHHYAASAFTSYTWNASPSVVVSELLASALKQWQMGATSLIRLTSASARIWPHGLKRVALWSIKIEFVSIQLCDMQSSDECLVWHLYSGFLRLAMLLRIACIACTSFEGCSVTTIHFEFSFHFLLFGIPIC